MPVGTTSFGLGLRLPRHRTLGTGPIRVCGPDAHIDFDCDADAYWDSNDHPDDDYVHFAYSRRLCRSCTVARLQSWYRGGIRRYQEQSAAAGRKPLFERRCKVLLRRPALRLSSQLLLYVCLILYRYRQIRRCLPVHPEAEHDARDQGVHSQVMCSGLLYYAGSFCPACQWRALLLRLHNDRSTGKKANVAREAGAVLPSMWAAVGSSQFKRDYAVRALGSGRDCAAQCVVKRGNRLVASDFVSNPGR